MRKISYFRTFLGWGIGIPLTLLTACIAIVISLFDPSGARTHLSSRTWGKVMMWLTGVRVTVSGQEHLPLQGHPVVIVANHQSMFDIPAFAGYFPIRFAWIAKKELFDIPVFGRAMKAAGYIAIDRLQKENAINALDQAATQLRNCTIAIFPEGTRSKDGSIARFKAGAALLAESSGAPLLPVTISGSWERLPKGEKNISPGTIHLHISPAIDTTGKNRKEIFRQLQNIRQGMIQRLALSE